MDRISNAPDLIIHHARVFTADAREPRAKAVAIRRHRIIAVGNNVDVLELAGKKTRLIDAGGKSLLPAFCDAHIHFVTWSLNRLALPLADAGSREELLVRVRDRVAESAPGAWIVAFGWNESEWPDHRFPTAENLDAVTGPNHHVLLWRSDMHAAIANSAALRAARISADTPNPPSGRIDRAENGQPNGVLRERAIDLVAAHIPPASDGERLAAMRLGIAHLHALGVTAIHDQRYGEGGEGAASLRCFGALREEGELKLRVTCNVAAHDLVHARTGIAIRYRRRQTSDRASEILLRWQPWKPYGMDAGTL